MARPHRRGGGGIENSEGRDASFNGVGFLKEGFLTQSASKLIHRNIGAAIFGNGCYLRQSVIGTEEKTMTTAGQAFLWTGVFFCLSFAGIFTFWFAERLKSKPLRKP